MTKESAHQLPLADQDIKVRLLSPNPNSKQSMLDIRTSIVAGERVCQDAQGFAALQTCCDEAGGTLKNSGISPTYYCEVSSKDSGTGDWD